MSFVIKLKKKKTITYIFRILASATISLNIIKYQQHGTAQEHRTRKRFNNHDTKHQKNSAVSKPVAVALRRVSSCISLSTQHTSMLVIVDEIVP